MPTPQNREPGRRPRNPDTERYTMQGDWAVPNQHPTAPPQRRAPTQEQRRAAARRRNLSRSPRSAMLPAVPPQPLHRNRRARRGAPRSQPPAAG